MRVPFRLLPHAGAAWPVLVLLAATSTASAATASAACTSAGARRGSAAPVCAAIVATAAVPQGAAAANGENSTAKVRPRPSAIAARAGSAVRWRDDLATALAEAKRDGKPVFWYVPTVAGSPMDRKPELDRYLMGGPFSAPEITALLNASSIPLRAIARGDAQRRYGLLAGRFVEPGWLVLAPDGSERAREDRVTTLHPDWIAARLTAAFGVEAESPLQRRATSGPLAGAWRAYAQGDFAAAATAAAAARADGAGGAEAGLLFGCALHRQGKQREAREAWAATAARFADEPLAWKCAAEAEGHGPFGYGFEDFLPLPPGALAASGAGTRAAAGAFDEAVLRRASIAFLLRMQDEDGAWRDSRYDFGGTDGLPNVHAAVTALAARALLEASLRPDGELREAAARAARRACAFLRRADAVNLADRDELLWAHVYRLELFARVHELDAASARDGDDGHLPVLRELAAALARLQGESGAFHHEYENPFATAAALLALRRAEACGVVVDAEVVQRGVAALRRCRTAEGAFSYYQVARGRPRASVPSAAGRMPLCELALALHGASDAAHVDAALVAAFAHHDALERTRKYDDHADAMGYGGFFFWFDMLARSEAIAWLPDAARREEHDRRQRDLVRSIVEIDGCFVDSHELGRCYGTAAALLCLR